MNTERQYYRVDRRKISLIKFTFEAYEGVAVVSTLDAQAGLVALFVAPGCGPQACAIMEDLGRHFLIEHRTGPLQQSVVLGRGAVAFDRLVD